MKFALIGAELKGLDVHSNYQRTCELRNELIKNGLLFVGVQNIASNTKSQLFLIVTSDETQVSLIAKKFEQKAILIADEENNTEVVLVKSSKERKTLGKLVAVSKEAAKGSKFYITFTEDGKEYFYVTKKGISHDTKTGTRV